MPPYIPLLYRGNCRELRENTKAVTFCYNIIVLDICVSAGVGRTGTLVALDSLVMELDEEGHASIFNFICDLRHQRNFLVQSLVSCQT